MSAKETLFLIEQGRPNARETVWYPWNTFYLLDAAIIRAQDLRRLAPYPIRIRRVDVTRTSEVLGEWDHGEPVNPEEVAR